MLETQTQIAHRSSINKVFRFIDEHPDAPLSLDRLAKIACFSPFHFHRIFKAITGETVNEYVTRQRIEKAASRLIHQTTVSITEISLQSGFNNNTSFTRAFRKFYGVSPTAFRKQNAHTFSKIRQRKSKNGQVRPGYEKYICIVNDLIHWIKMNAKIEIKEMPETALACVTAIGCQNLENAYARLIRWATPRGLLKDGDAKMLTLYHDSFKITRPENVRMSACIILNEPAEVEGEVALTAIGKGKCIVGSFEIAHNEFEASWTGLFIWMHENGYKKADRNPFEIHHNNFNEHPEKKCIVDLYIPVK